MIRQISSGTRGDEPPLEEPPLVLVGGGVADLLGTDVSPWNDSNGVGQTDCAGALGATEGLLPQTGDGLEQNPTAGAPARLTSTRHGVELGSTVTDGTAVGGSVTRTIPLGAGAAMTDPAKAIRAAVPASNPLTARIATRLRNTSRLLQIGDPGLVAPIN